MLSHARPTVDSVRLQVSHNDTFYLAHLQDVWVYPQMVFKNKQQERFYWKTVRDVKRTLPLAKEIAKEMSKRLSKEEVKILYENYCLQN